MREDIKERIELIRAGKVPVGYKKTKLGIIPEEWEIVQIKDILIKVDNLVEVKADEEYTQIGIRSHGKGIFYKEPVTGKELGNKRVFWVEPDCFIVNIVFAWERAMARTTKDERGMIASHRFPMYRAINEKVFVDYLVQYFLTQKGKNVMEAASPGGAGRNKTLGQERFMKSKIICPTMEQQLKMVQILKVADKTIFLNEKELGEKKKIKKWLMQNLFARKMRLPGYQHKWTKGRLSTFLEEMTEKNKSAHVFNVKSISNKLGFINQSIQFTKKVASNDLSNYKIVKKGYIAYNPSRINVGSIALYHDEILSVISPMYVVIKTKNGLDQKYFMYYVKTTIFNHYMKSQLSGSVRETLKFDDLSAIKIDLPSYDEQKAIVKVLETADKEIELLEKKLELLKQEKKAMMQLLLTGIVRVSEK